MNSVGSYLCSCNSGFALASDKLGCDGKLAKIIAIVIYKINFISIITYKDNIMIADWVE